MNNNLKNSYISARRYFSEDYYIVGTKNKLFDFMGIGIKRDVYVKLVKDSEKDNIDKYLSKMYSFAKKRRLTKKVYFLFYLDKNDNIENKIEIEIN